VLDAVGARRAHVCALSLGGLTAMWLALHAPGRIDRLVLANTAPRIGTAEGWDQRIRDVRSQGLAAVSEAALPRWFTADFRQREAGVVEVMRSMVAACAPEGYIGCCGALRDADLRGQLSAIRSPTLVLVGTDDPVCTVPDGEALRDAIPDARLTALHAAHLSNIEQADAFTAAVFDFLSGREVSP
jgi:3-oxoadipate enol-lactonase